MKRRYLTTEEVKAMALDVPIGIKTSDGEYRGRLVEEHGWRMVRIERGKRAFLIATGQFFTEE